MSEKPIDSRELKVEKRSTAEARRTQRKARRRGARWAEERTTQKLLAMAAYKDSEPLSLITCHWFAVH